MGLPDALGEVTADQLMATMESDLDTFLKASQDYVSFSDYLRNNYPHIHEFLQWSNQEIPLETDEELAGFMFGAAYMAVALCRNVDASALPAIG